MVTRKFLRKISLRQVKVAVVVTATLFFMILFTYYWYRSSDRPLKKYLLDDGGVNPEKSFFGTPFRHMPINELYDEPKEKPFELDIESEIREKVYMIDTPGCQIPFAWVDYSGDLNKTKRLRNCGKRAVFLKKVGPDQVRVQIQTKILRTYLRKSKQFECCYRFIDRSKHRGLEDTNIQYSKCKKIKHGSLIKLESDFINIRCSRYNKHHDTHIVYDDVYGFIKKVNTSKVRKRECKIKYNVLMLGIDSMSMPRFQQMMPRTLKFFSSNKWYDFRGYQKIGDNTFPNLMAALTGKNLSEITKSCAKGMNFCNDLILWSLYNKTGYATAYGEDYLRLPDTFAKNKGFSTSPTHHYMRPLFLHGETELNNKSLVCSGKIPSGQQILNYALDFVDTYKADNFFGVFWMNSFSHNINSRPQDADKLIENFLNQLIYTGALDKTFIFVLSDHGIRFGESRFKIQSYYDERLPFMYAWLPNFYKYKYPALIKDFWRNGLRFVTPYDLYNTFVDINHISTCNDESTDVAEACPNCQSLLRLVNNTRECKDIAVDEKWCTCHKLFPLIANDVEGTKSTLFAVSYLQNMTKHIKTRKCWECSNLSLKNVIRIHFRYQNGKSGLYYVVAFTMMPGNMSYEAVVQRGLDNKSTLVGPISVISPYRNLGKCTVQSKDRLFCVCQKVQNCQNLLK